jgi:hypothetical protein
MIDPAARPERKPLALEEDSVAVLCEGTDEVFVVKHLAERSGYTVKAGKRDDNAGYDDAAELRALAQQAIRSQAKAIGLVFDAEDSSENANKRIKEMLQSAELTAPNAPLEVAETQTDGHSLKVAYLINPHGSLTGSLESLFMPQVRSHELWACIEPLLDCYEAKLDQEEQGKKKVQRRRDKWAVRAYIAYSKPHNTGIGIALADEILHCDSEEFEPIRALLKLLCE